MGYGQYGSHDPNHAHKENWKGWMAGTSSSNNSGNSPSGQGLGGIFELAGGALSGAKWVRGKFETPSKIIWGLATSGLTIYLMYSVVVEKKFTWEFSSIFATIITSILAFFVLGALMTIPVAILDFLLIKPIKWIVGRFLA